MTKGLILVQAAVVSAVCGACGVAAGFGLFGSADAAFILSLLASVAGSSAGWIFVTRRVRRPVLPH